MNNVITKKIENLNVRIENFSCEELKLENIKFFQNNTTRLGDTNKTIPSTGGVKHVGIFERKINFDPTDCVMQINIENHQNDSLNIEYSFTNLQMDNLKTKRTFSITDLKRGYQEPFEYALDHYFKLEDQKEDQLLYNLYFILSIWINK